MSTEGRGKRVFIKHNSLRTKLLTFFQQNPQSKLTRKEIAERFQAASHNAAEITRQLERGGYIKADGNGAYSLGILPLGVLPKTTKPVRTWSNSTAYVAPKPVAISVFHLASTL